VKFNPKTKFWKPKPNQKHTITLLPKEDHQLFHDYFIANHKIRKNDLDWPAQEKYEFKYNYPNMETNMEKDYAEKPMPHFAGDFATAWKGRWEVYNGHIRKITIPEINWEQTRNTPDWEEWEHKDFILYHTKNFERWRLAGRQGNTVGVLPYDTPREEVFTWAEGLILGKNTIEESGGNPNIMSEKELPINITLERAKIVNEWVPKKINDYRTLANRCSELWNCNLDIKDAEQLLEEVFIRLKEEGIKPNFFKNRS
jgi:hypothetical protein